MAATLGADLKLKILEIYNSKLDARIERKKFILERGLLHSKEKKRTKEEREVYNNMRVFARFQTKEEHEEFVQGLISTSPAPALAVCCVLFGLLSCVCVAAVALWCGGV
jgi:hypothetical protein